MRMPRVALGSAGQVMRLCDFFFGFFLRLFFFVSEGEGEGDDEKLGRGRSASINARIFLPPPPPWSTSHTARQQPKKTPPRHKKEETQNKKTSRRCRVGRHDLDDARADVAIRHALDVAVVDLCAPDL